MTEARGASLWSGLLCTLPIIAWKRVQHFFIHT